MEHGETDVDELNFDEARAQDDKKEPEQSEILGAEKDEKRAELAHGEFCVMEFVVVNDARAVNIILMFLMLVMNVFAIVFTSSPR